MVQERLDAAGQHPENQGQIQQEGIKLMAHIMSTHRIKDPGPKVDGASVATRSSVQTEVDPLTSVIEAYQNQPHTPEFVTQTHQAIW